MDRIGTRVEMSRWPLQLNTLLSIPAAALLLAAHGAHAVTRATGDFNGDGSDDVLQRNLHSGAWRYHTLVHDVPAEHALSLPTDPVWRFVAVGDFDGNGYDDILLRNVSTRRSTYYALGAGGARAFPINMTTNPLYDFLGAGDFDGDGKDEFLIRRHRDFGIWMYYDIEGTRAILHQRVGAATQNLDWNFVGIGDFNGDGRDDILIRHRERLNWIYYEMNGPGPAPLRRPGITRNPLFTFAAIGDFTGEGRDDVMLRNTRTREWIYYAMTGPRALLQRPPGMTRNPRWTIQAAGDFDGSGRATPLIRLSVSGGWALYDIQGLEAQVVHFPGMSRQQTWAAVGTLPAFHEGNAAQFSKIEFLQGPPTFRKDFRARQTIGPVNASRPENGGEALPIAHDPNTTPWDPNRGSFVWSADNKGVVTSVWERRMAIAVEATHHYRHPSPTVEVSLLPAEGAEVPLDILLDVTEPHPAAGYRTELVFDLPAEQNLPGGEVAVRLTSEGRTTEERLPLFGEVVERVSMTWIPISTPNYPAPGIGAGYMDDIVPHLPVARHRSRVGRPLAYQATGEEEGGSDYAYFELVKQVEMHHAVYACGPGDHYFSIYDYYGLSAAGLVPSYTAGFGDPQSGRLLVWSPSDNTADEDKTVYAHEFGHVLGVSHAPCGDLSDDDKNYPYDDGGIGPHRIWHWPTGSFVDDQSGRHDLMSYCNPQATGDYTYQMALHYAQAPHYAEWSAAADPCWEEDPPGEDAPTLSMAVIGSVDPDGSVVIEAAAPSPMPPTGAGGSASRWTLTVRDSQGQPAYQHPLSLRVLDPSRPDSERRWEARVPYPTGDAALVVHDESGVVRTRETVRELLR